MSTTATATAVKERPIIFSAPMVRAILEGRKVQTRRAVRNEARGADRVIWTDKGRLWPGKKGESYVGWVAQVDKLNGLHLPLTCPYGVVGDRLWVREAWAIRDCGNRVSLDAAAWPGGWPIDRLQYLATDAAPTKDAKGRPYWWNTRSPIHMPRWASRITLEITDVRVERLESITEEDARAEGCTPDVLMDREIDPTYAGQRWARHEFINLWQRIHGDGAWKRNDWVWAISFKRI